MNAKYKVVAICFVIGIPWALFTRQFFIMRTIEGIVITYRSLKDIFFIEIEQYLTELRWSYFINNDLEPEGLTEGIHVRITYRIPHPFARLRFYKVEIIECWPPSKTDLTN